MDVLPRITRQLVELFRAMSFVQRATFVAVPLLMLGGFAWLLVANRPNDFQAVSVVNLCVGVSGFQLVTCCKHGQTSNHAVHIKAVRAAGTGLFTRLR